jgi:hypothetical protein
VLDQRDEVAHPFMGEGEEGEEELPHSNPDKKDWH